MVAFGADQELPVAATGRFEWRPEAVANRPAAIATAPTARAQTSALNLREFLLHGDVFFVQRVNGYESACRA